MIHLMLLNFLLQLTSYSGNPDYDKKIMYDYTWEERNGEYMNKTVSENVVKKNPNIRYLTSGVSITPLKPCRWCYSFLSHESLTPEQGKDLIKKVHQDILQEISKKKEAIAYLCKDFSAKSPPIEKINLKITFWTKDYDRIGPPNISQIYLKENKIFVNYSDPQTQALLDPVSLD